MITSPCPTPSLYLLLSTHHFSNGGHAAQGMTSLLGAAQKSWILLLDCLGRGKNKQPEFPVMLQMSY